VRLRLGAPHAALVVLQGAALVAFGPRPGVHGFPLDDAWIHQVVARTFAETGTLGYVAGHHGAAATSYLWAALLAVNPGFLHVDPVGFALALNVAFSLGAGLCLLELLLRARPPSHRPDLWTLGTLAAVALATFGGNWLWFAYSGMEASLFAFLSLLAILLHDEPRLSAHAQALGAGACAGLLALTRPEAALLGPLLCAATFRSRRDLRAVGLLFAPWAAAIVLYVGSNLMATGVMAPATLSGRRWMWLDANGGISSGWLVRDFVFTWALRLRNYTLGTSSMPAFWASLGLAALGIVDLVRRPNAGLRLVFAWTLLHLATYALLMPSPGHGGRYQPLVPLVYLAAVAWGGVVLVDGAVRLVARAPAARAVGVVVSVAPWVGLVAVGVRDFRSDEELAIRHIQTTELGLGPVVDALPSDARVASFDIGGIGYASKRSIIDAGGLSDARSAALVAEGRVWEYLRDERVEYLVLPLALDDAPVAYDMGDRLALFDNPATSLEPVLQLSSPREVWAPGVNATWNAAPRQVLFRVRFTGQEGLRLSTARGPAEPVTDAEGLLTARQRTAVNRSLESLSGAGVRLSMSLGTQDAPRAASVASGWGVALGRRDADVVVPSTPAIPADEARAVVRAATLPYLLAGNIPGAATIVPHAITKVMRRWVDPRFDPMLPVAAELAPMTSPLEDTWLWGVPLAAALVAVGLLLHRRPSQG
jgi:hypothetical protein